MPGFFDRINNVSSLNNQIQDNEYLINKDTEFFAINRTSTQNSKKFWELDEDDCGEEVNDNFVQDFPLINQLMKDNLILTNNNSAKTLNSNGKRQKYMPIQKTSSELFEETYQIAEGPAFDKIFGLENDCEISVSGGDGKCPIISSFEECNFCPEILKNIALKKYRKPTQIQKCVIPLIFYKKYDIMGHAQTGSGKTAAFLLPIIQEIQLFKKKNNFYENRNSPFVIVLSPTKELAEQLANDARTFAEKTTVNVVSSYGDMPLKENIKKIRYGCDIFVATCGRLIHFVRDQYISLKNLMYFILDEADKLVIDDFGLAVKAVKEHKEINKKHRTLMFSATFNNEIQNLAQEFLNPNYYFVCVGEINRAADTVEQKFIPVKKYDKQDLLINLLRKVAVEKQRDDGTNYFEVEKTIVFVQHKRQSDRVAIALAQEDFLAISINADRTLKQRLDAVQCFTIGIYNILVATDVVARGLNFPEVKHIINFDLPEHDCSSYVHRIGRAGRAGNLGRATSFFDIDGEERHNITYYISILKSNGQPIPKFMQEIFNQHKEIKKEMCKFYQYETDNDENAEWY